MTDMSQISAAVATLNGAVTAVKTALDIAKKHNEANLIAQLSEHLLALAEARANYVNLQMDLEEAKKENGRLKAAFARRDEMVEGALGFMYPRNSEGKPTGFPYCPRCLEVDGRPMLLQRNHGQRGDCSCPQCKTPYFAVPTFF